MLWAVATLTFFVSLRIGDPVASLAGPRASARDRAHVRVFYGLDLPVSQQYFPLHVPGGPRRSGLSYRYHRPVSTLIAERFPRTMLLAGMAMALEVTLGVGLGLLAAARKRTKVDTGLMTASFLVMNTPTFLSPESYLLGFAHHLGWFPMGGFGVTRMDHVYHAVLPALALALLSTAHYARLSRNELVEVLQLDFDSYREGEGAFGINGAVSSRTSQRAASRGHVLGPRVGLMFSGAVVTEAIFAWPGLGLLAYESITGQDRVVIGCCRLRQRWHSARKPSVRSRLRRARSTHSALTNVPLEPAQQDGAPKQRDA